MSSDKLILIDQFLIKEFNACGETGDTAANKLKQLRRILLEQILIKIGKLPPEKAQKIINVFSIEQQFSNQVQCFVDSNCFGENPTVVKFNDLPLDEQHKVKEYITSLLASIRNLAKEGIEKKLLQSSSNSLKFFYSPKKTDYNQCGAALIFPGFDYVYMVNDQPVILLWGFESANLNFSFQQELSSLFSAIASKPAYNVQVNQDDQSRTSSINTSSATHFDNSRNSLNNSNSLNSDSSETVYPIIEEYRPTKIRSTFIPSDGNKNYNSNNDYAYNEESVAITDDTYTQPSSYVDENNSSGIKSDTTQAHTQTTTTHYVETNEVDPLHKKKVVYMEDKGHPELDNRVYEEVISENTVVKDRSWDWKAWLLVLLSILFFILLILLIWYLFFYLDKDRIKEESLLKSTQSEVVEQTPQQEPTINNIVAPPVAPQNGEDSGLASDTSDAGSSNLSDFEGSGGNSSPSLGGNEGFSGSSNQGSNSGQESGSSAMPSSSNGGNSSSGTNGTGNSIDSNSPNNDNGNQSSSDGLDSTSEAQSNENDEPIDENESDATDEDKNESEDEDDEITQEYSSSSKKSSEEKTEQFKQTRNSKGKSSADSSTTPKSNKDLNSSNNSAKNKASDDQKTPKATISSDPNVEENPVEILKNQSYATKNVTSKDFPPSGIKLHNKDLSLMKKVYHNDVVINAFDSKKKDFVCAFQGNVRRTQGIDDYHLSTNSSLCKSLNIEKITCKGGVCIINGNPGQRVNLFE